MNHLPLTKDGTVVGMYLGWVVPDTQQWEALIKLTKFSRDYHASYTRAYVELLPRYKGIAELLNIADVNEEYISADIPAVFEARMPRPRVDVGRKCEFLGLPYPDMDLFAYIARTGGKINDDPFNICPILTPSLDGEYEFYCSLAASREFEEYWNLLTFESKIESDGRAIYIQVSKSDTIYFADLPEYFTKLGGSIRKIEILNIPNNPLLGMGILTKITLSVLNPYGSRSFELVREKIIA